VKAGDEIILSKKKGMLLPTIETGQAEAKLDVGRVLAIVRDPRESWPRRWNSAKDQVVDWSVYEVRDQPS